MVVDDRLIRLKGNAEDWNSKFPRNDQGQLDFAFHYRQYEDMEKLQIFKDEVTWQKGYTPPSEDVDVVFNFGCGIQGIPHLMQLRIALFDALGINYVAVGGVKYCCGRLFDILGQKDTGQRVADRAMDRFESWHPEHVVQCCGSCLIEFNYQTRLREEQRGEAPFEDIHFTRFLLQKLRELGDDVPWVKSMPRKVMVHCEGDELHHTKREAREDVIATLELIPGVEFVGNVEDPSFGNPCSSKGPSQGSKLNDLTVEEYRQVQAEIKAQADAVGADMIVTQHFMCTQEWSKFATDELPIMNYQHLLAEALGIHIPDRWQIMLRLGNLEDMLEYSRPRWESWGMSEARAREVIETFCLPNYATQLTPCPCGGMCDEAPEGSPAALDCDTSWDNILTAGQRLPIIDFQPS